MKPLETVTKRLSNAEKVVGFTLTFSFAIHFLFIYDVYV